MAIQEEKLAEDFLRKEKINPLTFVGTKGKTGYIKLAELMGKFLSEQPDNTVQLLDDIISWELDLSQYPALETILRERYKIIKRIQ